MAKPAILTVDDDPAVLQSITRDLRSRFGDDYQIVRASSGADALKLLTEFETRGRQVALIASDQRASSSMFPTSRKTVWLFREWC